MTKDEFTKRFWDNVKKQLKQQKMRQKELCNAIGINQKTLSSMISRNTAPDIFLLTQIRNALHIECSMLLYNISDENTEIVLTPQEKVIVDLIRKGTPDQQTRKLNLTSALLRYLVNPYEDYEVPLPTSNFRDVPVAMSVSPEAIATILRNPAATDTREGEESSSSVTAVEQTNTDTTTIESANPVPAPVPEQSKKKKKYKKKNDDSQGEEFGQMFFDY